MSERVEVHKGFTRDELSAAFDRVKDPADWRAPISAVVPGQVIDVTEAAIEFFTAIRPEVRLNVVDDKVTGLPGGEGFVVSCVGYRNGPAGP